MNEIDTYAEMAAAGARWAQYMTDCGLLCPDCKKGRQIYKDGEMYFHRLGKKRDYIQECDAWKLHHGWAEDGGIAGVYLPVATVGESE